MEILFNYRPNGGQTITTNSGDKKLKGIRRGPRGIVGVIMGEGPIVIWNNDDADAHINDSEAVLTQKLIDIING